MGVGELGLGVWSIGFLMSQVGGLGIPIESRAACSIMAQFLGAALIFSTSMDADLQWNVVFQQVTTTLIVLVLVFISVMSLTGDLLYVVSSILLVVALKGYFLYSKEDETHCKRGRKRSKFYTMPPSPNV